MKDYDRTLKRIFSYPEIITALLQGFVPEAWIKDLDFNTLQKINVLNI